jgi:hypothetical protein
MKRKTLLTTAAVAALVIGVAAFTPAFARGPGMGMGPGMMGHGTGMGMGQGMMGQGMGPGQQAYGPGNCPGFAATQGQEVTVDSVTKFLESRLARWGNERLKIGKVEATDDKTIIGEIVTKDGSLVQKFAFDKATGRHQPVK